MTTSEQAYAQAFLDGSSTALESVAKAFRDAAAVEGMTQISIIELIDVLGAVREDIAAGIAVIDGLFSDGATPSRQEVYDALNKLTGMDMPPVDNICRNPECGCH